MATVFLFLFLVGFGLTAVSALLGAIHLGGHGHASDVSHGHGGHADVGHGHGGDLGHGHGGDLSHGHGGHSDNIGHGHGPDANHGDVYGKAAAVSPVNFQTLVAFLMGFGGVGYLTTHLGFAAVLLAIPLAVTGGVATSWLLYKWLQFLLRGERPMDPTTYIGVIGRLTVGIRTGGTGEMVYAEQGTRAVSAARSVDGTAIARGEEVVVLRYERGIAYVQPWKKYMEEERR